MTDAKGQRSEERGCGSLCQSGVFRECRRSLLPALPDVVAVVGVPGALPGDDPHLLGSIHQVGEAADALLEQDVSAGAIEDEQQDSDTEKKGFEKDQRDKIMEDTSSDVDIDMGDDYA